MRSLQTMRWHWLHLVFAACLILLVARTVLAADDSALEPGASTGLPLLVDEKFDGGAERWQPASAEGWKLIDTDAGKAFSQFKHVKVETPHRSPWNIALLKDISVSDFVLEVKMRETAKEYPHRDACLVFGYQDPAHLYYVHCASTSGDSHANQVFIVNGADRKKITNKDHEAAPVKWGGPDQWHRLKIVRSIADGLIEAYFDDMQQPIMTAHDRTLLLGQIGIGTFDDTADFAEVKLWGFRVEETPDHLKFEFQLEPRITPIK